MKDSQKHASLHSKACLLQNCDPSKCSGDPNANVRQSTVNSAEATLGRPIVASADREIPPPQARRPVEPGPPDPMPTRIVDAVPTGPEANAPDPSSEGPPGTQSTSASPSSTYPALPPTGVEPGPPELIPTALKFPDFYDIQEDVPRSYRSYDAARGVTYDASGIGWCIRCNGTWSEIYHHYCPSQAWSRTGNYSITGPPERPDQALDQDIPVQTSGLAAQAAGPPLLTSPSAFLAVKR
jgi:hypothetical protein